MKKFVTVFMALAMVFAFVLPAMADEVCPPCEKCEPIQLSCPSGGTQEHGATCVYGDEYAVDGLDDEFLPDTDDCPVVFNVCECDDPNQFTTGKVVGIRLRILVNGQEGDNGVYFAENYTGNVIMSNTREFLCDPSCSAVMGADEDGNAIPADVDDFAYFCDKVDDNEITAGEAVWRATQFPGPFSYWQYKNGQYVAGATPSSSCTQGANNKVVQIVSPADKGIEISKFDETYNLSHWAIDIPDIIVTPAVSECSTISVEICLLVGSAGGICGECQCVCSCVYDLYKTCCVEVSHCLLFPFVPFTDTGWNAGIALSDVSAFGTVPFISVLSKAQMVSGGTGSSSTDRTVTFMFVPEDGQVSTWTDSGIGPIKTYNFAADILPNLDPAPTSTVGELMLKTNFTAQGMLYLTNGVFGAAHLGACCYGPCGLDQLLYLLDLSDEYE